MLVIDKDRVNLLMKRSGTKTYRELALNAGLHYNTVTRVLNGSIFDSVTADKMAQALKCNPIDLMTAEGFPDPNLAALAVH